MPTASGALTAAAAKGLSACSSLPGWAETPERPAASASASASTPWPRALTAPRPVIQTAVIGRPSSGGGRLGLGREQLVHQRGEAGQRRVLQCAIVFDVHLEVVLDREHEVDQAERIHAEFGEGGVDLVGQRLGAEFALGDGAELVKRVAHGILRMQKGG
mmetsp:Transcript_3373/g.5795  ORF Transcript_3373/g.5795 Transcript_3373/m.5795 type:complete len:160 (+) Transcript_3373:34-513(+)